jgi:hypothetical protein
VASGQVLAEIGSVGEIVRQSLLEVRRSVVILLRLRQPARKLPQIAPVVVGTGQVLAKIGSVGEVGR